MFNIGNFLQLIPSKSPKPLKHTKFIPLIISYLPISLERYKMPDTR